MFEGVEKMGWLVVMVASHLGKYIDRNSTVWNGEFMPLSNIRLVINNRYYIIRLGNIFNRLLPFMLEQCCIL